MRQLLVALALIPATAAAEPPRLSLEQVIAKAQAGPRARMAGGDRDAARARVREADAARLPRIQATMFGTISPEITCLDPACTRTDPQNFALQFDGVMGGAMVEVTQPLYTFGKLSHARRAARAGVQAQQALADETAGDVAVDAARAYWGIKLARELGFMLDDGIDEIDKALARIDERRADSAEVTVQDRQRVAVLLAEARVQRADAQFAEAAALAGLRALVGIADADVDAEPLAAVQRPVPSTASGAGRPQAIAARAGAVAADELAAFSASHYWPDLALVGSAAIARAQGVTDPPSAFANDPFNRSSAALALALRWRVEPWTTRAQTQRARAEADKARAQAALAEVGAGFDATTALAEVRAAHAKVQAAADGDQAGRAWVVSVLQADAVGAVEAKDLADAYLAWFQIRARWALAVFQWNVAVIRLDRAAGQFRAGR